VTGVAATLTIFTVAVFMLLFGREVVDSALRWVRPRERARAARLVEAIRVKVGGYVAGTLLVSCLAGVVTAVTTALLGVPYFLALGLAMVFLTLIPFVGQTLGLVLVTMTTLAAEGPRDALIAAAVLLVYPQIKNRLIQPLVLRRTIQMNPLLITLVMLLGGASGGLLGIVLALPIAGTVQVLLRELRRTREERWATQGERTRVREPPPELPAH
jgi:predicted PurR-regulated permease PerM